MNFISEFGVWRPSKLETRAVLWRGKKSWLNEHLVGVTLTHDASVCLFVLLPSWMRVSSWQQTGKLAGTEQNDCHYKINASPPVWSFLPETQELVNNKSAFLFTSCRRGMLVKSTLLQKHLSQYGALLVKPFIDLWKSPEINITENNHQLLLYFKKSPHRQCTADNAPATGSTAHQ